MGKWTFKQEPAAWVGTIKAILVAGMAFGLNMTGDQLGVVVLALEAIGGLLIRQNVFAPVSKDGDQLEKVKYEGQPIENVEK